MKRTNIYMEEAHIERLPQIAKLQDVSTAEITRRILDFGLKLYDPNSSLAGVVAEALKTFDDTDTPERACERALVHWAHDRENNSIRGSQRRQEAMLYEILSLLKLPKGIP